MRECNNNCPSDCSTVCDNYYGCVTDPTQSALNVAIGRPVCASKNPGQVLCDEQASKAGDGAGMVEHNDWCYHSGEGTPGHHFIRIELDGVYLLTHVKLDMLRWDNQRSHKFEVLVCMVSATDGYVADEVCG
jgi:hypothetical protein